MHALILVTSGSEYGVTQRILGVAVLFYHVKPRIILDKYDLRVTSHL